MRRLICWARGHGYVHIPTLTYRPHTRWCGRAVGKGATPSYTLTDVMVFASEAEAHAHGCRRSGGGLVTPDGRRALSVKAHRQLDGLRVTSWAATERALEDPHADRVIGILQRSMAKADRRG